MRTTTLILVLALMAGCGDKNPNTQNSDSDTNSITDADNDGLLEGVDCDDTDPSDDASYPKTWYADTDNDGYGDSDVTTQACTQPGGYVANNNDCDDVHASTNPGATEYCDNIDNNCNGVVDDGADSWYEDADGDGYGSTILIEGECDPEPGMVANSEDCDDSDASVNPGEQEICDGIDNDCDGMVDNTSDGELFYADNDNDSYGDPDSAETFCDQPEGYVTNNSDCDDTRSDIHPDATETCDEVDNDCDGEIDGEDATDVNTWFADADLDGYGDPSTEQIACDQPTGYVANDDDCDDDASEVNPDATETCDEVDNDCDGDVDESSATDAIDWYVDADGDGYGSSSGVALTQCDQPSSYVSSNTDCDDTNASVNPAASEVCDDDNVDEDCSGTADDDDSGVDSTTLTTWYADADSDSYGDDSTATALCDQPSGYVETTGDCDDTDSDINPDATETCNGEDDDCDGTVDEDVTTTFYIDADSDGEGDEGTTTEDCSAPTGYVDNADDCDDTDTTVNTEAEEVCDSVDNDCDGTVDEDDATDASIWYIDVDGDTFGRSDGAYTTTACTQPTGYVADATDCDDGQFDINPDATETCDEVDNDCDGDVDEGVTLTWYLDADGDDYGDASVSTEDCSAPTGYVSDDTDCDDADATTYPDAPEVCDSVDNDCDGSTDENLSSNWYQDSDGDGYGTGSAVSVICNGSTGPLVDNADDCDDTQASANPGNTIDETCDEIDDDCDGSTDEDADCTIDTGDTGISDTGFLDTGSTDTGDTGMTDTGLTDTGDTGI